MNPACWPELDWPGQLGLFNLVKKAGCRYMPCRKRYESVTVLFDILYYDQSRVLLVGIGRGNFLAGFRDHRVGY